MATNNTGSPRRSARPAVYPARLRHAGEPGAAAGFGLSAASQSGTGGCAEAAASSTTTRRRVLPSPDLPAEPSVEDLDRFLIDHDRYESLANTESNEEILDVGGPASPVSSFCDESTSGREKHGRARSPLGDRDSDGDGKESEAAGKGEGATRVKKRRQHLPLSERKPPKEQRYNLWSVIVLQKVCQHRRIKGQQRNRDKDELSAILEKDDRSKGRASPYTGDFGGNLAPDKGENPDEESDSDIPPGAMMGIRTMMRDGVCTKKRSDTILFEGKRYGVGRLLDALKKSRGDDDNLPDEDLTQSVVSTNTRKSKSCLPRLVNIMVLPHFRKRIIESEAQASRAELDNGAVGANRSVWVDLTAAFKDPATPVNFRISDDVQFLPLDPGTCYQPTVTPGKLLDMYNNTRKKLGTVKTNFKKSGMGEPIWNFCSEDIDVLYLHAAGEKYPELAELTQTLMPDDVAEEAGMSSSSDEESSGDDDDDEDSRGGRSTSRAEARKLKAKSKARQATTRRQKKAKEAVKDFMPALRREIEATRPNATATTGAQSADDSNRALQKHEADMKLQAARIGKVEEEKQAQTRENRRHARAEYKRLREDLRKEKAEPERDEAFITVLEEEIADALELLGKRRTMPDA